MLLAVVMGLGFLWIYFAGKDINWDLINYHYYGAALLVEGRLDQDFFAANVQSYINPIAYVPFYFLFKWGLGSLTIAFVLGLCHLANLYVLWLIVRRAIPGRETCDILLRWQALMLALVSPVYLTVLGSTFADPFSSTIVLSGLLLLHNGDRGTKAGFYSGVLFGAAAGLKLTNLVFMPAFFVALVMVSHETLRKRTLLLGLLGAVIGWLLLHGYWSYLLWERFRNPIFPFANDFFRSSDFLPISFHDKRFQLGGLLDLILLPWRMMAPRSGIYTENISPDIRPFAFVLCIVACALAVILKKRSLATQQIASLWFILIAYVTWLILSTIGRYALPIWLLCGAFLPYICLIAFGKRIAIRVAMLILVTQTLHGFLTTGNFRWQPNRWEGPWLEVSIPKRMRTEPALYLSIGVQTYASVIPFFDSRSSFINVVGQYPLPYGNKMLPRMRSLINKWEGNTYVLGSFRNEKTVLPNRITEDFSSVLSVYGFRVQNDTCSKITMKGASVVDWAHMKERDTQDFALWACKVERMQMTQEEVGELAKASAAFEKVEKACSEKLTPIPANTIKGRLGWQRLYFDQQSSLIIRDNVVVFRPNHSFTDHIIGTVDEVLAHGTKADFCTKQAVPL